MYVCLCKWITESRVREFADSGLVCQDELASRLGVLLGSEAAVSLPPLNLLPYPLFFRVLRRGEKEMEYIVVLPMKVRRDKCLD